MLCLSQKDWKIECLVTVGCHMSVSVVLMISLLNTAKLAAFFSGQQAPDNSLKEQIFSFWLRKAEARDDHGRESS
jgi:hypothetical protein